MPHKRLTLILVLLSLLVLGTASIATATYIEQQAQQTVMRQAIAQQAFGGNYGLNWNVVGGGVDTMSSGSYTLQSTVGQTVIGESSSANYTVAHGFWQTFIRNLSVYLPQVITTD